MYVAVHFQDEYVKHNLDYSCEYVIFNCGAFVATGHRLNSVKDLKYHNVVCRLIYNIVLLILIGSPVSQKINQATQEVSDMHKR